MKYREMKFKLNNKEHSEVVQEVLFQLGFRWWEGPVVQHTCHSYLYTDDELRLSYGNSPTIFESHDGEEIDVSWMDPVLNKTVEYNGKTYSKAAFEKAIAELEVLNEDV